MTTRGPRPSGSACQKQALSRGLVPKSFVTALHGPTSLEVLLLRTAKTVEAPDRRHASNQSSSNNSSWLFVICSPLSLSENQTANRLGTFLTNWNLFTTAKWILQAVSGYKIPFLRPLRHWRAHPTVFQEGQFQVCHFNGGSLPTTVHFNILSSGERTRGRGVPPYDQPKGTKQISSEGKVDETRPQGRLLCSPNTVGVEEVSSV